jgi:hypothetical protein
MTARPPQRELATPITCEWLDHTQVAWLFGVTVPAVKLWTARPEGALPFHMSGTKHKKFNIYEVIEWYRLYKAGGNREQRERWARPRAANPEDQDEKELKRKLAYLKTVEQQQRIAQFNKDWVPVWASFQAFARMAVKLRTNLLSFANRLRGEFGDAVYQRVSELARQTLLNTQREVNAMDHVEEVFDFDERSEP